MFHKIKQMVVAQNLHINHTLHACSCRENRYFRIIPLLLMTLEIESVSLTRDPNRKSKIKSWWLQIRTLTDMSLASHRFNCLGFLAKHWAGSCCPSKVVGFLWDLRFPAPWKNKKKKKNANIRAIENASLVEFSV